MKLLNLFYLYLIILSLPYVILSNQQYPSNSFDSSGTLKGYQNARKAARFGGPLFASSNDNGIFLFSSKKEVSSELVLRSTSKVHLITDKVILVYSGVELHSHVPQQLAANLAMEHKFWHSSPVPILKLCEKLGEKLYEEYFSKGHILGGHFTIAGWDEELGYQIYCCSPDGSFDAWKSVATGNDRGKIMGAFEESLEKGEETGLKGLWQRTRLIIQKYYLKEFIDSNDNPIVKGNKLVENDVEVRNC